VSTEIGPLLLFQLLDQHMTFDVGESQQHKVDHHFQLKMVHIRVNKQCRFLEKPRLYLICFQARLPGSDIVKFQFATPTFFSQHIRKIKTHQTFRGYQFYYLNI
jgi:hypothetical protein